MKNTDGTLAPLNNSGLVPTADKILVEPMRVEEKTRGGIVLASQSLDKEQLAQTIGTVIAMGRTCKLTDVGGNPLIPEVDGINIGDMILFARYSGAEFPIDGVSYRIMKARDVIGKATKLPDSVIRGAQSSVATFGQNDTLAAA